MPSIHKLPAALATTAALLAAGVLPATAPAQAPGCDVTVAAGASGIATVGTLDELAERLGAGQTGCVRGTVKGSIWIAKSGATLTSEPGQRGTILGQVVVDPDAANVTVRDLDLNARGLGRPSPIVLGDDALIAGNDITNEHTPILCMIIGAKDHDSGAVAERTRIEGNRVHDCGVSDNHRHGIYVEHATDTKIVGNFIYGNADRGIQLFPDAQNTLVAGNVIDGNGQGVIFSGEGGSASSGNVVRNNLITNPRLRAAVESWYPEGNPVGRDNVAHDNCLYGGDRLVDLSNGGFTARDNLVVDPLYADRAAGDFTLPAGSPCAQLLEAGRSEMSLSARTFSAPAEAATARTIAPSPFTISVKRSNGRVRVAVRLRRTPASRSYARVRVRYGTKWKTLGIRRVTAGRSVVVTGRAPKGRKAVQVRATLLSTRTTFRNRR
jgi:hypothetical protein